MTSTTVTNEDIVAEPPFEMTKHHKKALMTLLFAHHINRQTLTYAELSDRIGVGEKTKAWQCGAWKDLKSEGYIVSSSAEKKRFELSEKGIALASTLASDEELAEFKVPETNEELHDKIKAKLERLPKARLYGPKILDLMLSDDYIPMNRHDMAAKLGTLADSRGFFYGLQALKKDMKYVEVCTDQEVSELKQRLGVQPEAAIVKEEDADGIHQESADADESEEETNQKSKKRKAVATSEPGAQKKVYKSKKKRTGGKPLKLSNLAYVHTS